jgi:hypothetical protein
MNNLKLDSEVLFNKSITGSCVCVCVCVFCWGLNSGPTP